HERIECPGPALRVAIDARLEPPEQAQRPVDELRRERAIPRLELHRAVELRVEGSRRERLVGEDASDHGRSDRASIRPPGSAGAHSAYTMRYGGGVFVV